MDIRVNMEWNQGDLVWFDPGGLGHPLPGEIQEVHQAAQIIVVQAVINGKVGARGAWWPPHSMHTQGGSLI